MGFHKTTVHINKTTVIFRNTKDNLIKTTANFNKTTANFNQITTNYKIQPHDLSTLFKSNVCAVKRLRLQLSTHILSRFSLSFLTANEFGFTMRQFKFWQKCCATFSLDTECHSDSQCGAEYERTKTSEPTTKQFFNKSIFVS